MPHWKSSPFRNVQWRQASPAPRRSPVAHRSTVPTRCSASTNLLAIGVIQAFAASQEVRVPDDIAVIGYDDIEFAQSTIVPLSTIRTPHAQLGTALADLLFDAIARLAPDAGPGGNPQRPPDRVLTRTRRPGLHGPRPNHSFRSSILACID
ncbi:substrate-binding domain-containing protein [Saccharomonospora sp. NPDC046836]|uniref:substrate-binding domain-containing protein n=1 Tax=Saccharomonospora sp. NPDC046836 TaxID=3156921 RepID=UPI0033DAAE70